MRIELPKEIDELPNGPHKKDLIRQFVKKERGKNGE